MRFVAIAGSHMLQRHRHWRGDIAQLVKHAEELAVAGGEADAPQVRALRQRLKRHDIVKSGPA